MKPYKNTLSTKSFSSWGFTLLEALVALVIFSIGLLGLAGLQILSLQLTGDSMLRTIAAVQANDMIDRMRANTPATTLGVASPYNNPAGTASANPNCLGMNGSGGAVNASCTPTQMAGEDFYEWYANIAGAPATGWHPVIVGTLPQGAGVVCIDSTPEDGTPAAPACDGVVAVPGKPIYAIKLWWVERKNATAPGVVHQYVVNFSL
jgi:type IV pilus assembly protein PilV